MHVTFEDDEFYKRKFNIKPFSIQVDKLTEKDVDECVQQHKSRGRGIANGILRWAGSYKEKKDTKLITRTSRSPAKKNDKLNRSRSRSASKKRKNAKKNNSKCNDPADEYYKEVFQIQDCQISLPKVTADSNNKKRKLAFIFHCLKFVFDYLTFYFSLKICFLIIFAIVFVLYFL